MLLSPVLFNEPNRTEEEEEEEEEVDDVDDVDVDEDDCLESTIDRYVYKITSKTNTTANSRSTGGVIVALCGFLGF
jgi:hypothetical protein